MPTHRDTLGTVHGPWGQVELALRPIEPQRNTSRYALYPLRKQWYVNIGFWDVIRTRKAHPRGHFNRLIEEKVAKLGGIKSLYSDSFFSEEAFWRLVRRRDISPAESEVRSGKPLSRFLRQVRTARLITTNTVYIQLRGHRTSLHAVGGLSIGSRTTSLLWLACRRAAL